MVLQLARADFQLAQVVPDDNSCLFTAVGLLLEPGKPDIASTLRQQVAEVIRSQPDAYSEAMLG